MRDVRWNGADRAIIGGGRARPPCRPRGPLHFAIDQCARRM
jgi:hypothetical protein